MKKVNHYSLLFLAIVGFIFGSKKSYIISIIIVDNSKNYNSQDCSKKHLCNDINSAVNIAKINDTILIQSGTYVGDNNNNICLQSNCTGKRLSLIGNGEVVIMPISPNVIKRGIVSYNGAFKLIKNLKLVGFQSNNTYQELLVFLTTKVTKTVYGGSAINVGRTLGYTANTSIIIEDVTFINNNATLGGALSVIATTADVINCTFTENFATLSGGAFFSFISNVNIDKSTFKRNKVASVGTYELLQIGSVGGAVYIFGSSTDLVPSSLINNIRNKMLISNCYFRDNVAVRGGGAVYMESVTTLLGTLEVVDSKFHGNSVSGKVQCESALSCISRGGAIYASAFGVVIKRCDFRNNSANSNSPSLQANGGALYITNPFTTPLTNQVTTTITGSTFYENSAVGSGGAIYAIYQSLNVSFTTFSYNHVLTNSYFNDIISLGGAVYYSGGISDSRFFKCTFDHNKATNGWGGALYGSFTENWQLLLIESDFKFNTVTSSYTNKAMGGAIFVTSSFTLNITSSNFIENVATPLLYLSPSTYSGYGGAIYVQSAKITIEYTSFIRNKAITGEFDEGANGGAITLSDSNAKYMKSVLFHNNSAIGFSANSPFAQPGSGGAIYSKFSSLTLQDGCKFEYNWVSSGVTGAGIGGAIAVFFNTKSVPKEIIATNLGVNIFDSKFHNNLALPQLCVGVNSLHSGIGGAISFYGAATPSVTLRNVSFFNNFAASAQQGYIVHGRLYALGGAISMSAKSNITADRCTFKENAVLFGIGNDIISYNGENYFRCNDCKFVSIQKTNLTKFVKIVDKVQQRECRFLKSYSLKTSYQERRNRFRELLFESFEKIGSRYFNSFSNLAFTISEKNERRISMDESEYISNAISAIKDMNISSEKAARWFQNYNNYLTEIKFEDKNNSRSSMTKTHSNSNSKNIAAGGSYPGATTVSVDTKVFVEIISANPNFAGISGIIILENPLFVNGSYHVFFGSINDIYKSEFSSLDGGCRAWIYGTINDPTLIISVVNATLALLAPTITSTQGMKVGQIGLFKSTLYVTNNITSYIKSFVYNSTIESVVASPLVNRFPSFQNPKSKVPYDKFRPVIKFKGDVYVGLNVANLFLYAKNSDSVNVRFFFSRSFFTVNYCNVVIFANMSFASFPISASSISSVDVFLYHGAFINITKNAQMHLGVDVNVRGNSSYKYSIFNSGMVSLEGDAGALSLLTLNVDSIQVGKGEAPVGLSLFSKLKVYGNYFQTPTGRLRLGLNTSSQNEYVVDLESNKTFSGNIDLIFPKSFQLHLYPPAIPSKWSLIKFRKLEDQSQPINGVYYTPIQIKALPGISFIDRYNYTKSKTNSYYTKTVEVSKIGCDLVSQYYSNFDRSFSTTSGVNYGCYICVYQNSSCDLCSDNHCAVSGTCIGKASYSSSTTCCPGGCVHGSCKASVGSGDSTSVSFQCNCDSAFYNGPSCNEISPLTWGLIAAGIFLFIVAIVGVYLHFRGINQKKRMLDEIRDGILNPNTAGGDGVNSEYIQGMQQALILNDVFVKYEEISIEEKVGEGSFGVVFKATFRGAQVAVKQMRSTFLELTEKEMDEFKNEAYVMSRLRHPNIVLVMGISVVDIEVMPLVNHNMRTMSSEDKKEKIKKQSTVCIITEFLEQGSLADILYGPTKLPNEIWTYELVLTCALQAARGMLYLHSHQPPICHRDLKSSNLVVDDHWVVKVTDFGMSRIVPDKINKIGNKLQQQVLDDTKDIEEQDSDRSSFASVTRQSEIDIMSTSDQSVMKAISGRSSNLEMTSNLGTTAWCAPELFTASNTAKYSIKVDVYSFGMVLWELWEKKRPFDEFTSRFDIMDAVKAGKRPVISSNCPPTYRSLIQRCWQAQPSRRPMFKYITRYLKEELAQVKRQRNNSSYNDSVHNSLFHNMFSFGNQNKSSFRDSTVSAPDATTVIINDTATKVDNPILVQKDKSNSDKKEVEVGLSFSDSNSLHENRSALVAAFDKGLNHLIDNEDDEKPPSMMNLFPSNQTNYNNRKSITSTVSNDSKNNQWRDKYVMRFSGWRASNPDDGLPPSMNRSSIGSRQNSIVTQSTNITKNSENN